MINEINAELLLHRLYPELEQQWTVRHKGTFYRNYSDDSLSVDLDEKTVEVARDGLLKLLPPTALSDEYELSEYDEEGRKRNREMKTRYEEMQRRLMMLSEAFLPVDTLQFRQKLKLEGAVCEVLDIKLRHILKAYFDIALDEVTDEYVKQAVIMLPYVSKMRGRLPFVRNMLSAILNTEVRMFLTSFSYGDHNKSSLPKVHYDVIIDGLSAVQYAEWTERLKPLASFIKEWFIPFSFFSEISVKSSTTPGADESGILNYNEYVL